MATRQPGATQLKQRVLAALPVVLLCSACLVGCSKDLDLETTPSPAPTGGSGSVEGPASESVPEATGEPPRGTIQTGIADVGAPLKTTPVPQVYEVQRGDTLSSIALRFGCDVKALTSANGIGDPNSLRVGQELRIPSTQIDITPSELLLPNSEFVNSPAYLDFDVTSFCAQQGGYLSQYREKVNGTNLTGPEIVELTVQHYSVGPRMLLAMLEYKTGWVTNPNPPADTLTYPMGYQAGGWQMLYHQLAWAANELNRGYYNWRGRGVRPISWKDGSATRYDPSLNAATAGLQFFLSLKSNRNRWERAVGTGPDSFLATYRSLFGGPAQYAIEPLIPANTLNPNLVLPWSMGEMWFLTSGPHGAWGDGSAWSALDFVPDEGPLGCRAASSMATSAAAGVVIHSHDGIVMIDLDEDGHEETGWVLFYLHVAKKGRVAVGTWVKPGDPVGHPSCEGGQSNASHLHIARKYNGEWIAADGPLPLVLSGWVSHLDGKAYDGSVSRDGEVRTACECWEKEYNGLLADR